MKQLPVPPLEQSLDRYLETLSCLQTEPEQAISESFVAGFLAEEGPACQAELIRFAELENAAGHSWMSEAWFDAYFAVRTPLPLTSNVAFQINWNSRLTGAALAADVARRLAAVHLRYLRGEAEPDLSPRGEELSPTQWRYLAGGIRHPRFDVDTYLDGPDGAGCREIVVLRHNHAWAVRVADGTGNPLPRKAIESALQAIIDQTPATDGGFTDPSYLGGDDAAGLLDELLTDTANDAVYTRLRDALFVLDLADEGGEIADAMRRLSFDPGQAWAFKTTSFQVGLADGFLAVHFEHSLADGATLKEFVSRAQRIGPDDRPSDPAPIQPLAWHLNDETAGFLTESMASYRSQAADYRVEIIRVPFAAPEGFKFSHDAGMQWVVLAAQLATWGRARSTYEAVDMREYLHGRTECLRSLTPEALSLARGLLTAEATADQVFAARAAHSRWVKACKSGNAFDRHLFGLRLAARRLGLSPEVFADEGYRRLTTELLSTTSLGDRAQLIRLTFAPTSPGGIGVNYTADPGSYEFCLSWRTDERPDLARFVEHLAPMAEALAAAVQRAARA
ncbi:MAG: choline/carnitine O-acyltransferase [Arachnia sp.]